MSEPSDPKRMSLTTMLLLVGGSLVAICAIGAVLLAKFVAPSIGKRESPAARTACLSQVRQMSLGMIMYAADNDDRFPPASAGWMDQSLRYTKNQDVFHCPSLRSSGPSVFGYAANSKVLGLNQNKAARPADVAMLFESDLLTKNASSGLETLPDPGRHNSSGTAANNIAFLDGHAKPLPDGSPLPGADPLKP